MKVLINYRRIGTVRVNFDHPKYEIQYSYPLLLLVAVYNPFRNEGIVNKWFGLVQAGGFHFMGLMVRWTRGPEYATKREIKDKL